MHKSRFKYKTHSRGYIGCWLFWRLLGLVCEGAIADLFAARPHHYDYLTNPNYRD